MIDPTVLDIEVTRVQINRSAVGRWQVCN